MANFSQKAALLFLIAAVGIEAVTWQRKFKVPRPAASNDTKTALPGNRTMSAQLLKPFRKRVSPLALTEGLAEITTTATPPTTRRMGKIRRGYWFDSARKRPPTTKTGAGAKMKSLPTTQAPANLQDRGITSGVVYKDADESWNTVSQTFAPTEVITPTTSPSTSTMRVKPTRGFTVPDAMSTMYSEIQPESYYSEEGTVPSEEVPSSRISLTDAELYDRSFTQSIDDGMGIFGARDMELGGTSPPVPKRSDLVLLPTSPKMGTSDSEVMFEQQQITEEIPQTSTEEIGLPVEMKDAGVPPPGDSSSSVQVSTDGTPKDKGYVLWSYMQGNQSMGWTYSNINGQARWTVHNQDSAYTVESGKDEDVRPALFGLTVQNRTKSTGEIRAVRLQIARKPKSTAKPEVRMPPVLQLTPESKSEYEMSPTIATEPAMDGIQQRNGKFTLSEGMSDLKTIGAVITSKPVMQVLETVAPIVQSEEAETESPFDTFFTEGPGVTMQFPDVKQQQQVEETTVATTIGTTEQEAAFTTTTAAPETTTPAVTMAVITTGAAVTEAPAVATTSVSREDYATTSMPSERPLYVEEPAKPKKGVPAGKRWLVVGDGGPEGWMLLGEDGMLEWKIEYMDGKWKVIDARALDIVKKHNILAKLGLVGGKGTLPGKSGYYPSPVAPAAPSFGKSAKRQPAPYPTSLYGPGSDRAYVLYDLPGTAAKTGYSSDPWLAPAYGADDVGDWDYSRRDDEYVELYPGLDYGDESSKVVVVPQEELSTILGKQVGAESLAIFNKTFGQYLVPNATAGNITGTAKDASPVPKISGYALKAPVRYVSGEVTYGNTKQDAIDIFRSLVANSPIPKSSPSKFYGLNSQPSFKGFSPNITGTSGKQPAVSQKKPATTDFLTLPFQKTGPQVTSDAKGEKTAESLRYQQRLPLNNVLRAEVSGLRKSGVQSQFPQTRNPSVETRNIVLNSEVKVNSRGQNQNAKLATDRESTIERTGVENIRWSQPMPPVGDGTSGNSHGSWRISGPSLSFQKQGIREYQSHHHAAQTGPRIAEKQAEPSRSSGRDPTTKERRQSSPFSVGGDSVPDRPVPVRQRGEPQEIQQPPPQRYSFPDAGDEYHRGRKRKNSNRRRYPTQPVSSRRRSGLENTSEKRKKQVIFIDYSREEDTDTGHVAVPGKRDVEIVIKNARPRNDDSPYISF